MRTEKEIQTKLDEVRDALYGGEISEEIGEAIEDALTWALGEDSDPIESAQPKTYEQIRSLFAPV